MNTVWDIFVQAIDSEINLNDIFLQPAQHYSPYYELALCCINDNEVCAGGRYQLNPLYRYPDIWTSLLEEYSRENIVYIFNWLYHYFFMIENRMSDTKQTYEIDHLIREIQDGVYGSVIKKSFGCIPIKKRKRICQLLILLYRNGQSRMLLTKAINYLFPSCYLYEIKKERMVLLYPGEIKSYIKEQQLNLIKMYFIPIDYEIDIFWNYHFGIIDIEDTMILDEIELG